jgi:hypothetical protein
VASEAPPHGGARVIGGRCHPLLPWLRRTNSAAGSKNTQARIAINNRNAPVVDRD